MPCTETMHKRLSQGIREAHRLFLCATQSVNEAIFALCPFKSNPRSMLLMECEETTIQIPTFLFHDTNFDFASSLLQLLDAQAVNFCKQISTPDDNARDTTANDKVGTRRRLAEMGTRFQADIDSAATEKVPVFHAGNGVHFRMRTTTATMKPFSDNASIAHHYSPHHRIGSGTSHSTSRQLDATSHEF